jgi:hypothetical protein
MIREYVEDQVVLVSALQTGHVFVPVLADVANKMIAEIERGGCACCKIFLTRVIIHAQETFYE